MNVSFAGCGFLAFYHLGVATCLSSHAPQFLKNVTAFAGASAGSLVATMLATSAPLNKCTDFVIDLTDEARRHPLGPFNPQFDLVGSLRKCLQLYLPSNSHKIASGRLYISVTSLKDRKNAIISEFESTEELIQVLLASCYIPFYSGFKFPQFKGQKWVDGGLSDNLPRLPFGRTIRISPFSGKHNDICPQDASHGFTDVTFHNMNIYVNRENLQRELQIFLPPKREGIESLVQLGFDDALRFLQRENLCSYPLITQDLALPVIKSRQL
ncbi:patatin-like phospholipase domain-containing protein 4 isoform X1 [Montipora capricornis]|uniref:patatin-like phospholipase domain-containing protein 4 isoform X1 n=1 Tax=Montipora foliosa TaxID=591990 RepID=UPI0035F1B0AF